MTHAPCPSRSRCIGCALAIVLLAAAALHAGAPGRASTCPIPALNPGGRVYKTEGPTDPELHVNSIGAARTVMLFVDFPDAPGDGIDTAATAAHLLGDGEALRMFRRQSYGRFELTVDRVDGWRRMPRNASDYTGKSRHFGTFAPHKRYIAAACALFPEVRFSDYQMLFLVAAKTRAISLSPAFNARRGHGARTPTGEVCHAVTFGHDSYTNRPTNLVHEVGHLLGLPDLYRYGKPGTAVGPWAIMCDIFRSTGFIGWHRHKLGWLLAGRSVCIRSGELTTRLTPLSSESGVSMVVVPVGDSATPSQVFVIEIAQPIIPRRGKKAAEGVLVYRVDATRPTGKDPAVVFPSHRDPKRPHDMDRAPFGPGDVFEDEQAPLRMQVVRRVGDGYDVVVTCRSATPRPGAGDEAAR